MAQPLSLYDSYLCKELRASKQQYLIKKYATPVVTIKPHIPSELCGNSYVKAVIKEALLSVKEVISHQGLLCIGSDEQKGTMGEEFYFAIQCPSATELKKFMMKIERTHPLGQLMDLNVMNRDGKTISRGSCELAPRRCIICNQASPECAKNRQHSLSELDKQIHRMLDNYRATA